MAILYSHIKADIAVTGGVHSGADAIKALMAGASTVMMASALLEHGIGYLKQVSDDMTQWLQQHGYTSVNALRGRMSQKNVAAPAAFERANYIEELNSYTEGY